MKSYIILVLIFFILRFIENLVNKWVEKSKLTANKWDDIISITIQQTLKYINSIFKFKK